MAFRLWLLVLWLWPAWHADAAPQDFAARRFDQAQLSWAQTASPPAHFDADTTALPSEWQALRPGHSGQAWYRIRFDAPATDLPAVLIERACTNAHIWLNGSRIHADGVLKDPITRHCYQPYWVALPAQLLKSQGNVLDIQLAGYAFDHVAARQRHAGLSQVWIGSQEELRGRYDKQYFWNITIAQIIGVSMTVFGLAILMLFAMRQQDRHFLYFGLAMIGWALLGIRLYWERLPLPGWASEMLIISLFPPVVACAVQFLMHYVRQPKIMVTRLLVLQSLAVPSILLLMGADWIFRLGSAVFTLLSLEFMVALVYAGWHAWRLMRTDFWVVGSSLLAASLMTVAEIAIQNDWLALPRIHLIHFGLPWVFLAITTRLVQQFAQSLARSERITQELEQRVAEKGREIQNNYEQISLLRANEAAQRERQRIAADLHDDLGAKLLSIIHSGSSQAQASDRHSAAHMARQALDEMRLSVRGLTAQPIPMAQVLADWRTEAMERSYAAGLQTTWHANEPPMHLILGARTQVQLTRILREAVSNVIRHAQAQHCEIHIHVDAAMIELRIDDDGRGLGGTEQAAHGHGLNNIERRARHLGGLHQFGTSALGGASVKVRVPLGGDSQPMPLE